MVKICVYIFGNREICYAIRLKKKDDMDKRQIPWEVVVSLVLVIGTILGVTIPLHMSIQEDVRAIRQEVMEFHREMRDFHGRLIAIEEKKHP